MAPEVVLQLGLIILTLSLFFVMHTLRAQIVHVRSRTRNRAQKPDPNRNLAQASRHLIRPKNARAALDEAHRVLSIDPREPSAHILRARALRLMGHQAAALKSLDSALSPPAVRLLSAAERAEALVERAELKLEVNRKRRMDSAVEDLVAAVELSEGERVDSEALCLLGKCYEWKGMTEEAKETFQKVLDAEPDSIEARKGLARLGP